MEEEEDSVHSLREVLTQLGVLELVEKVGKGRIASGWKAKLIRDVEDYRATACCEEKTEDDNAQEGSSYPHVLSTSDAPPAFFVSRRHASAVEEAVNEKASGDGLRLVRQCRPFTRPQVCFASGWAKPGSRLADVRFFRSAMSFGDVLDGCVQDADGEQRGPGEALNLQLFHRKEAELCQLPNLPRLLRWPRWFSPDCNHTDREGNGERLAPSSSSSSSCSSSPTSTSKLLRHLDDATRVSCAGAITWWHLDDGGEFVLQVGLPLRSHAETVTCDTGPVSFSSSTHNDNDNDNDIDNNRDGSSSPVGPNGRPAVKLFIFLDRAEYSITVQDTETERSGRICGLSLFETPDESLPSPAPTLWVALLEAGGKPLLSTPNAPHMVITLQNCVMVEQRALSALFLDDAQLWLARAATWRDAPVEYDAVREACDAERWEESFGKPLRCEYCIDQALNHTQYMCILAILAMYIVCACMMYVMYV